MTRNARERELLLERARAGRRLVNLILLEPGALARRVHAVLAGAQARHASTCCA